MKKNRLLAVSLALLASISIFAAEISAEPYTEQSENGSLNWSTGEASASGIGVPPERYLKNPPRARAMAIRAAKVDALRNLLETVEGVRVQSQTLVKDMAVESDLIRTVMQGTVRNAKMVGKPHYMEDGSVEVTMAINYRESMAKTVLDKYAEKAPVSAAPSPATAAAPAPDNATAVTGLVIDAVGKGLKTALAPRILDEAGNVVYAGAMVAEDKQSNIVAYDTSASDAARLPRLGGSPLTIKALKVQDKTDVIISNEDAATIGKAAGMQDAMHQARVAFAL